MFLKERLVKIRYKILISTHYMNPERESYPEKKTFKSSKRNGKFTSRMSEDTQDLRFAGLTKAEFVTWYIILFTQAQSISQ